VLAAVVKIEMAGADMEGWFFQSYRAFQERPVDDGTAKRTVVAVIAVMAASILFRHDEVSRFPDKVSCLRVSW
jgi:hypothetical protein